MTVITPARMYDSATPSLIPADAQIVAGYIDGDYAWKPADWARFPEAVKVTITVRGNIYANVADVENGDMTPADARQWIELKQRAFQHPATLYSGRETDLSACRGLAYYRWVADWTDQPHPLGGAIAVQYQNVTEGGRQLYDLSVVYDQVWLDAIDAANRPWRWDDLG